jgi:hypothetical protein
MKQEYYLYLVENDLQLMTREDAIALKLMNPNFDIWNAFDSLDIEPMIIEEKK